MASRAVPAVVAQGNGLGQGDVQAQGGGDGGGDLGYLDGVGHAGALMIIGEDEHLGLAGQPAKGGGMQDSVAVALETGSGGVGLLRLGPLARAPRPGRPWAQVLVLPRLFLGAFPGLGDGAHRGAPLAVSSTNGTGALERAAVAPHGRGPRARPPRVVLNGAGLLDVHVASVLPAQ